MPRHEDRGPGASRRRLPGLLPVLVGWLIAILALVSGPAVAPAWSAAAAESRYRCDGDVLVARMENGAVDAIGIPNTLAGTLPGAYVVIDWRGEHLQLPRSNQAGAPRYSDGRWWWSLEDPLRPDFRQLRASETRFHCVPETGTTTLPPPAR
ncbi:MULTISPECIES: hypothetical protein [Aphanothece]|uniref:hypothetical protein n=1 Tax=Aphanothece TaxID=1121 RepID=UPI0039849DFF